MLSVKELRSSTKKELLLELTKSRADLMKTRISVRTKHEKNTSKKGKERRYVAQILTALNELEAEEAKKTAKSDSAKAPADAEAKADKSSEPEKKES